MQIYLALFCSCHFDVADLYTVENILVGYMFRELNATVLRDIITLVLVCL
jgi:hypothetical protein